MKKKKLDDFLFFCSYYSMNLKGNRQRKINVIKENEKTFEKKKRIVIIIIKKEEEKREWEKNLHFLWFNDCP